ncbi:MAG: hypothetical protein ACK4PI_01195 [Tepidisphaerales bacterium]
MSLPSLLVTALLLLHGSAATAEPASPESRPPTAEAGPPAAAVVAPDRAAPDRAAPDRAAPGRNAQAEPGCGRGQDGGCGRCGREGSAAAAPPASPAPPADPGASAADAKVAAVGPSPALRTDQDVFHALLRRHKDIRREVTEIPGGVETLTESDDPEVAGWIREHVHAMKARVEQGRPLRRWDPLFRAIFDHAPAIRMEVHDTARGVRVRETSDEAYVTLLIRAHARVVSGFVAEGFAEAERAHPVPEAQSAASGSAPAPAPATQPSSGG